MERLHAKDGGNNKIGGMYLNFSNISYLILQYVNLMTYQQCYPVPYTQNILLHRRRDERASERNGSRPLNAAVAAADSDSGVDLSREEGRREEENELKLQHFGGE